MGRAIFGRLIPTNLLRRKRSHNERDKQQQTHFRFQLPNELGEFGGDLASPTYVLTPEGHA